jgi:hypothetical protein
MIRILLALLLAGAAIGAERFNHEGRLLGPLRTVSGPTLFNTAQADVVLASMQIMPVDSPWNEDVSGLPVLANSAAMLTGIADDLSTTVGSRRRKLQAFGEMNFVLLPDSQAGVPISFFNYPGESEPGPYPIPVNLPIEGWPGETGSLTLAQWQQDVNNDGGDRHAIMVEPGIGRIWETWLTKRTGSAWAASNGARFDLASNATRTAGWTSGDAAGLPMFPALVRYDEVQRGAIEHAMRLIVKRTRTAYLYPGNHIASNPADSSADVPAMGERLRLKASFSIPSGWTAEAQAVARALQKYGCLVADNGSFFQISVTPDDRWPSGCFEDLTGIVPADFEVVQGTGLTGGPRAGTKPTASAGADRSIAPGTIAMAGSKTGSGTTATWSVYPAPSANVSIADVHDLTTNVTFSAPGVYVLRLAVSDATHVPAYDGLLVTVTAASTNPLPVVTGLSPDSAVAGDGGFTLTITGANFLATSTVTWTGQPDLAPATQTATQLTVAVPAAYVAGAGIPSVRVVNPIPAGGASPAVGFVVSAVATAGGSGGGTGSGGGSSSGGGGGGGGGGCGLGSGLTLVLLALLGLRLRR